MRSFSRADRVSRQIQEEIASMLAVRINDPLLKSATITGVKLTRDLMLARVYYYVPGDPEKRQSAAEGFARAAGFIRRELAASLSLKHTPQIEFFYDEALDRGQRIDALLRQAADSGAADGPAK